MKRIIRESSQNIWFPNPRKEKLQKEDQSRQKRYTKRTAPLS
jgi:hypothetical protein